MRQVGEYLAAALLKENHPRFLKIGARSSTLVSFPARAVNGGGVIGIQTLCLVVELHQRCQTPRLVHVYLCL